MKSYSLDLREKVLNAVLTQGMPKSKVARTFGVSRDFVYELLRRHEAGESIEAKPRGGTKPKLTPEHEPTLRQLVAEQNDRTLDELRQVLEQRGGPTLSRAAMHRALVRLKLPRKKRRSITASETANEF
ncbi:MAG: IS630 transposase-related protein [Actinomycetota bacterium]|nr:IS630 transposase-related protein [Actinomycetota bacterium]